ncbi:MAG: DUF599 domain-containing protein [Burkholderiales bacterium]|jgi:uncharacterized membrane protein|nr:DUF599 domain-containing protein [Burkholderiales bacterium]
MQTFFKMITVLPGWDWAALLVFFSGWIGYAHFAKRRATTRPSVLASTNRVRREWMLQSTRREARVIDAVVMQNLSSSPSFFASTTILIIGGLLAALSTTDRASELVRELPFTAQTSLLVFDLKLLLLLAIFVYGFFRFTWSMRQYTFGAMLVATAPEMAQFDAQGAASEMRRNAFADRAGRVISLAAESFNDGLRAYYFAFAAIGWFSSPVAFVVATAGVIVVLYRREFRSEVLAVLNS